MTRQCSISIVSIVLLAVGPASQLACTELECGEGTIEEDGACVPSDIDPDDAQCGEGAVLEDGFCVPENPTVCDPETTVAVEDPDTHIITCQGTGTSLGCDTDITCPQPSSGNVTICGQIYDVETDAPIQAVGATGVACDLDNPTDSGPCSLQLKVYDAIEFAGDPTGTDEIGYTSVTIDDCGRFAAVSIDRPPTPGFVGLGLDDNEQGSTDTYVLGGVALPTTANLKLTGFHAYAVRASTNEAWSNAAGVSPTFAEQGVYVPIYRYDGVPVTEVQVTRGGAVVPADDVFYFDDADPFTRLEPNADATSTGANGSALVINSGLVNHSGSGGVGIPAECEFSSALASSIEQVVFVQVKEAVLDGTLLDLCPAP